MSIKTIRLNPGTNLATLIDIAAQNLSMQGFDVKSQLELKMNYKGVNVGDGLRLDIIVNDELIVELKSVEELKPVHYKQLLTYLKLSDKRIGLLINFNVKDLMDGIKRVVNGY